MKNVILIIISGISMLILWSGTGKKQKTMESNNIRNYLIQKASDISDHSLSGINTLAKWQNMRNSRYNELVEMMGLTDFPLVGTRSPMNIKITGTLQEEGYHIEKLYYESLPGLYVRANLYIPDHLKKSAPAILYVCGHSPSQKVHYQAHPRKFAQLGFVCLIIETIQFGEVQGDHWGPYSRGWFNWYSRGYNPAGVELWNAIRGIDLLSSRSEVDPGKIGVTGISGGGSQSWYIAAIDPRIKAVSPVCGASTLKAQIISRTIDGHCDALLDGKCNSLILKNPPETQDQSSDPGGKGPAIEMLNCLRYTDVYQIPALITPAQVTFAGKVPTSYQWSEAILEKLGKGKFTIIQ